MKTFFPAITSSFAVRRIFRLPCSGQRAENSHDENRDRGAAHPSDQEVEQGRREPKMGRAVFPVGIPGEIQQAEDSRLRRFSLGDSI